MRLQKNSGGSGEGRVELETVIEFSDRATNVVARLDQLGRDSRGALKLIHECEQRRRS
ncbi:DNA invertase Pin-like site-specific DNA recombinase [Devosia sp. UYZn731]|uniref:hypothetical protein n=1 Tax=Devosia sp. UYZn731 TaxID=3156345 RepID=UPI003396D9B7